MTSGRLTRSLEGLGKSHAKTPMQSLLFILRDHLQPLTLMQPGKPARAAHSFHSRVRMPLCLTLSDASLSMICQV